MLTKAQMAQGKMRPKALPEYWLGWPEASKWVGTVSGSFDHIHAAMIHSRIFSMRHAISKIVPSLVRGMRMPLVGWGL